MAQTQTQTRSELQQIIGLMRPKFSRCFDKNFEMKYYGHVKICLKFDKYLHIPLCLRSAVPGPSLPPGTRGLTPGSRGPSES